MLVLVNCFRGHLRSFPFALLLFVKLVPMSAQQGPAYERFGIEGPSIELYQLFEAVIRAQIGHDTQIQFVGLDGGAYPSQKLDERLRPLAQVDLTRPNTIEQTKKVRYCQSDPASCSRSCLCGQERYAQPDRVLRL